MESPAANSRPQPPPAPFRMLRQFNHPEGRKEVGRICRFHIRTFDNDLIESHFAGDSLQDRLARALAENRAVRAKEIFETFEFFAAVRKHVRAPHVADLCCGHGLTGLLFALFERRVERVTLCDHRRPDSFDQVLACVSAVGPWVVEKVAYHTGPLKAAGELLTPGASVVAQHACGELTDRCIDLGLGVGGALALMPCCQRVTEGPTVIERELGIEMASDIHRTYRLERHGYHVRWINVPPEITPMHRILVCTRKASS